MPESIRGAPRPCTYQFIGNARKNPRNPRSLVQDVAFTKNLLAKRSPCVECAWYYAIQALRGPTAVALIKSTSRNLIHVVQ